MVRYIAFRVFQGVLTSLVLVTLVFFFTRVIGTPVDLLVPNEATPEMRAAAITRLGLDRPVYEQYFEYMGDLFRGDIGTSIKFRQSVVSMFLERFPNTVRLAVTALVLGMLVGVPLGVLSAVRRNKFVDHLVRSFSVIGMSAPNFWVGLMLMVLFAVHLRILPVARMSGFSSYILPAATLSLGLLAGTSRLVRSSLIEVMSSEYVKLARIKGVSASLVVWKHALRNALLPVLTFFGITFAGLINGSVAVETVFAWPGVGRLVYEGIVGRDYPLVQGCLLILGFLVIIISLLVDIIYAYVDPRIRYGRGK
ncbi:MAG TPA: ABC transporter permease [Devosia sp.]|nr:ABC transporter permease [Devosia sp.]